jgi:cell wall assembly regulator SMI1
MKEAWEAVLAWYRDHPTAGVDLTALNPPASEDDIRATERFLKVRLPKELKWLYRRHDGLDPARCGVTLDGCQFLSLEEMRSVWKMWKDVYDSMRAQNTW